MMYWLRATGLMVIGLILAITSLGAELQCLACEPAPTVTTVYKTIDQTQLIVRIIAPENDVAARPCLIFYHGGGWTGGRPVIFDTQAAYFASRGMVVIQPSYRLLNKKPISDGHLQTPQICITDARSAYRWVVKHADSLRIDPARIAVGGASAGGHLAACLGMIGEFDDPTDDLQIPIDPKAMLLLNPVIDNGPDGYGYQRMGKQYVRFSPFHNVTHAAPPTLILVGSEDRHVPQEMVRAFAKQMDQVGARCNVLIYPGQKHSFFSKAVGGQKVFDDVINQMDRFLISLGWLTHPPVIPNPDVTE